MAGKPMTLSDLVGDDSLPVLVEHQRCGASLGIHHAWFHDNVNAIVIAKSTALREGGRKPKVPPNRPRPGAKGPLTAPGISYGHYGDQTYARVFCACLPAGHNEKMRIEKVGSLPVTFPTWKWGRPIDLPVVVF